MRPTREPPVSMTESAARRIAFLMSKDAAKSALRVQVKGGGCAGFQYSFNLDDKDLQEDKEPAFDTFDTLQLVIAVLAGLVRSLEVRW